MFRLVRAMDDPGTRKGPPAAVCINGRSRQLLGLSPPRNQPVGEGALTAARCISMARPDASSTREELRPDLFGTLGAGDAL